jgi:4-alpha-glucanotransferase
VTERKQAQATRLLRDLHEVARRCGIQTSYRDQEGHRRRARPEAVLGAIRAFGHPIERLEEAPAVLRRLEREPPRPVEPVTVAWGGRMPLVEVRAPAARAGSRLTLRVELESGEDVDPAARLPFGYHRLHVEGRGFTASSLVVSAPPALPNGGPRSWGVFLPLYALRSARSWGVGDLTDLGDLLEWASGLGGRMVATLPMLASFLDEPFEPSPYSPASRLFWNELFLDVTGIPELERSPEARRALASAHLRKEIENLQTAELVDYRAAMAAKRQVLEPLARSFFEDDRTSRRGEFESFLQANPASLDYARFRAACDRHRSPWQRWPGSERSGILPPAGGNEPAYRYHAYVQWLASQQMLSLQQRSRASGAALYFDLPLGVHPAGYDVWREREIFATGATAGAPPDPFFTSGQDWGFFPLHPERVRDSGYGYPIACLRHQLRVAGVLRIDHAMGLHRLFWIPSGLSSTDGVYVRYPADEMYAIVVLEAARAGAMVVGEDLGIVPGYIRPAMARRGIHRTYVVPWELTGDPAMAMRPPPERSFASLNTHDMPPFAAYWPAEDPRKRDALIRFLRRRGWLAGGKDRAAPEDREVMVACLGELAASDAREVIVNLEDLWLETRPQNVPGTGHEQPNWRRPARYRFERFRRLPQVTGTLRRIEAIRKGSKHP